MPLQSLSMAKRSCHWMRTKTSFFCSMRPKANFTCKGHFQKYQQRKGLDDLITFSIPKCAFSISQNTIMLLRFNLRPQDQMVPMSLNAFCKQLSTRHNTQTVTQIEKPSIPSDAPVKLIHGRKVISLDLFSVGFCSLFSVGFCF